MLLSKIQGMRHKYRWMESWRNILDAVVAGSYTHVWKEEDDSCGSRDLYYYDNPETVLQFSMYDVRLTLSENP